MPDNDSRSAADLRLADLDLIQADARHALTRERPGTDAIWSALLKPRRTILRRYREALAMLEERDEDMADQIRGADGRQLVGALGRLTQPEPDMPAILGIGEALVAKALMGDSASLGMLLDRIEGRPGVRKDENDPEELTHRRDILEAIEGTVRRMQERPGDKARDVTPPPARANGQQVPAVIDVDVEVEIRGMYPKNGKSNGHDK